MGHITLTEDQLRTVAENKGRVEIRDPSGRWLGVLDNHGWTHEELVEAKRRVDAGGPGWTTEQVMEWLKSVKRGEPLPPKPVPHVWFLPRTQTQSP